MILHKAWQEEQDKTRRWQDKTMSKAKTQSFVNNNKKNCHRFHKTKQRERKEKRQDEDKTEPPTWFHKIRHDKAEQNNRRTRKTKTRQKQDEGPRSKTTTTKHEESRLQK